MDTETGGDIGHRHGTSRAPFDSHLAPCNRFILTGGRKRTTIESRVQAHAACGCRRLEALIDTHTIALVMWPGMAGNVLAPAERARLHKAAPLVSSEVFETPFDIPGDVASDVTILLTGWGCPPLDDGAIAHLTGLQLVAHAAGTVKGLVTPALYQAGIAVTSAADANAIPVAEFTLAAIVMAAKDVFASRDQHRLDRGQTSLERQMALFEGSRIGNRGRTIGLVGASRVGRLVSRGLERYDCEALIYDPFLSTADAVALGAEKCELDELCRRSDIVSIHAPLLPSTERMIGSAQLEQMRDGAWLINTARGAIVDTEAATAEAVSGRLSLFIDTTDPEPLPADSPLYDLPNVVLTPHIAGSLGNEISRLGAAAVSEIEHFIAGRTLDCPVSEGDLDHIA